MKNKTYSIYKIGFNGVKVPMTWKDVLKARRGGYKWVISGGYKHFDLVYDR